jgi:hypothetical protein
MPNTSIHTFCKMQIKAQELPRNSLICRDNRLDGRDGIVKLTIQISLTPKKFKSEKKCSFWLKSE